MHQSCGLKCLPCGLERQACCCELAKLRIDQWEQIISGKFLAGINRGQQSCQFVHKLPDNMGSHVAPLMMSALKNICQ